MFSVISGKTLEESSLRAPGFVWMKLIKKKPLDFIDCIKCQVLAGGFQVGEISDSPPVVDTESRPTCLCCHGSCVGGVQMGLLQVLTTNSDFRKTLDWLGGKGSRSLSYPTWILLRDNGVGPQIRDGNLISKLFWENQFPPPPDAGSLAGQIYCDLRKGTGKEILSACRLHFSWSHNWRTENQYFSRELHGLFGFCFWEGNKKYVCLLDTPGRV